MNAILFGEFNSVPGRRERPTQCFRAANGAYSIQYSNRSERQTKFPELNSITASAGHISKPTKGFGLQANRFESLNWNKTIIYPDKSCLLLVILLFQYRKSPARTQRELMQPETFSTKAQALSGPAGFNLKMFVSCYCGSGKTLLLLNPVGASAIPTGSVGLTPSL